MSPEYKVAGVCCGPHPEYGTMCVLTLAGNFIDATLVKSPTGNQANSNVASKSANGTAAANSNKSKAPKKTRGF